MGRHCPWPRRCGPTGRVAERSRLARARAHRLIPLMIISGGGSVADDLRALFSSNDASSFDTDEAFTDRGHQWAIVAAAVEEHLHRLADLAFDAEDLERPRTNLVVFHGVGGVGKSTLMRKLEAALTTDDARPPQWGAPAWTRRLLPIRIDLARSASTGADFERVILTIRL